MARTIYLTPAELSARWNRQISIRTLANWRSKGPRGRKGPDFLKLGSRVLYTLAAVEAWELQNEVLIDPPT